MYVCMYFFSIRDTVAAHLCVMIVSSNNSKDLGVTMDWGLN
jgi:hypothetical protein